MNYLELIGKNARKAFEDLKGVKHSKIKKVLENYNQSLLKNSNKITDTKNVYFSYRIENGKENFYRLNEELEKLNTLASHKKYISYFGEYNSNYYHPNEISASLFEILIECELEKKPIPKIPAIIKLEEFLN